MPTFHDPASTADIDWRFTYHPPASPAVAELHAATRRAVRDVAQGLNASLPPGREKSLAITKLEEAMFWANAAIARYEHFDHVHVNPEALQPNPEGGKEAVQP